MARDCDVAKQFAVARPRSGPSVRLTSGNNRSAVGPRSATAVRARTAPRDGIVRAAKAARIGTTQRSELCLLCLNNERAHSQCWMEGSFMSERGDSRPTLTWKVELTLEELGVIERALTHLFAHEIDARSGRKPSAAAALLTRVLGRTPLTTSDWSAFSVDEDSLTVTISNERFVCKPTSFRLLSHLIHQRGRWIRTEELRRQVLATAFEQDASNIRWHVLQPAPGRTWSIVTTGWASCSTSFRVRADIVGANAADDGSVRAGDLARDLAVTPAKESSCPAWRNRSCFERHRLAHWSPVRLLRFVHISLAREQTRSIKSLNSRPSSG